jgi:hypothetical protein
MADTFDALALGVAKKYNIPADLFLHVAKKQEFAPQLDVQPPKPVAPDPVLRAPKVKAPTLDEQMFKSTPDTRSGLTQQLVSELPELGGVSKLLETMKRQQGVPVAKGARERRGATPTPVAGGPLPPARGDWSKWVRVPPPRGSSSKPHTPQILGFVGAIGQGFGKPLAVWDNTTHSRTTVNGNVSAHYSGNAADIPARGAQLKRLGYIALVRAGMNPAEAKKASRRGGLFDVGGYQVIFATSIGGNHFDHLHVGIRR